MLASVIGRGKGLVPYCWRLRHGVDDLGIHDVGMSEGSIELAKTINLEGT